MGQLSEKDLQEAMDKADDPVIKSNEQRLTLFRKELASLINKHGIDADFNVRDFIAAEFMIGSIINFSICCIEEKRLSNIESTSPICE